MLGATTFLKATWSALPAVRAAYQSSHDTCIMCIRTGSGLYIGSCFMFFFFPPNFCVLLAPDTGHLQIPVIHEDTWKYLNL